MTITHRLSKTAGLQYNGHKDRANARWDAENRLDAMLPALLAHIMDETPITARQCIKSLAEVGQAKPQYIPAIWAALVQADFSGYKDSMRPLLERDAAETQKVLRGLR